MTLFVPRLENISYMYMKSSKINWKTNLINMIYQINKFIQCIMTLSWASISGSREELVSHGPC